MYVHHILIIRSLLHTNTHTHMDTHIYVYSCTHTCTNAKTCFYYQSVLHPFLIFPQGARLTAFEIVQDGLPGTLIADSMASALMAVKGVDCVVVGADRVAANG